jgi:hypothetical protein
MDRSVFRIVLAAAFFSVVGSASPPARAQVPAPPSDVDPCSLGERQKSGDDCLLCRAYYRNNAHCAHVLTEYGFARSCRMRGASMWREVWCRKKDPSARQVPAELLASLDDATAGEPRADASIEDAAVTAPVPVNEAGPPPVAEASTREDVASPVAPKGQASGCGTCAIGSRRVDGPFAAGSALAVFVAYGARRRRRITPSTRDRSGRS